VPPANSTRFALGTAQLGLRYGVANAGQVTLDDGRDMLSCARSAGVDTLDTAIAYGDSEARLGSIGVNGWRVISKLPAIPERCPSVGNWVRESVTASLERLRTTALHALLLHRPSDLFGSTGEQLYIALQDLQRDRLVGKLGVSVYQPRELDQIWRHFEFEIVQAPFNVFDRRFLSSGWMERLHAQGAEVHIRSIFLQGLLLLDAAARPPKFDRWRALWELWTRWQDEHRCSALEACLNFALSHAEIDRIVVGVDTPGQLRQLLALAAHGAGPIPAEFEGVDETLIDPSRWGAL